MNGRTDRQVVVQLKPEHATDIESRKRIMQALPPRTVVRHAFDSYGMAVVELPDDAPAVDEVVGSMNSEPEVAFSEQNTLDSASA